MATALKLWLYNNLTLRVIMSLLVGLIAIIIGIYSTWSGQKANTVMIEVVSKDYQNADSIIKKNHEESIEKITDAISQLKDATIDGQHRIEIQLGQMQVVQKRIENDIDQLENK